MYFYTLRKVSTAYRVLFIKPVEETTDEDFDSLFAANVRGPFVAMREAAKLMKEGGRIINFSSNVTRLIYF
jgi:3-oxoacyl-[acyl-carrier protein] reductase